MTGSNTNKPTVISNSDCIWQSCDDKIQMFVFLASFLPIILYFFTMTFGTSRLRSMGFELAWWFKADKKRFKYFIPYFFARWQEFSIFAVFVVWAIAFGTTFLLKHLNPSVENAGNVAEVATQDAQSLHDLEASSDTSLQNAGNIANVDKPTPPKSPSPKDDLDISPLDIRIGVGLLAGWIAFMATRMLTASQLGPKLLERFNSDEFYAIRRRSYLEMQYWLAGDRFLISVCYGSKRIPLSIGSLPADKDRTIAISQILGMICELHSYHLRGVLSGNQLRFLMRDRFSWFAKFLIELRDELSRSYDLFSQARRMGTKSEFWKIPYPFLTQNYGYQGTVEWLVDILDLEEWRDEPRCNCAENIHNWAGNNLFRSNLRGLFWRNANLSEIATWPVGIPGWCNLTAPEVNLADYDVLLDTNIPPCHKWNTQDFERVPSGLHYEVLNGVNRASWPRTNQHLRLGLYGFLRILRRKPEWKPAKNERNFYLLDRGLAMRDGFHRTVIKLEHRPKKPGESSEARYWFERLWIQGLTFAPHLTDQNDREQLTADVMKELSILNPNFR